MCLFRLMFREDLNPPMPHQVFETTVSLIVLSRPSILGSKADNDEWFQDPHNHICCFPSAPTYTADHLRTQIKSLAEKT